jgi:lysozyme
LRRRRRPGVARWRRLFVFTAALIVIIIVGGFASYEGLSRYRPGLKAGERYGVDVSNHQGDIAWDKVAADGVSFAYIKAAEGDDFVDKRFADNWAKAGAAGITRGAYHFFTLCSSGAGQAENFLRVLPADANMLPPAVDLEFAGCDRRPDNATVQRELRVFVDTVEQRIGKPVVVYALPSFEKKYPVSDALSHDRWQRRPFRRPAGNGWTIWQASSLARVDGIHGHVDLDVARSTR